MSSVTPAGKLNAGRSDHSASLLPAVISTLSSSNAQYQEHEKKELEKQYGESDQRLDKLLALHHGQLATLIEAFTKISGRLNESRTRIANIKENLFSCKNLLHCKRDELRKFWLEELEQDTITTLLEHVENLRGVPEKLEHYIEKKLYLHATNTWCESTALVKGDLAEVTAVKDIAYSLEKWKEKLLEKLVDELHIQIYVKSVKGTITTFKQPGSISKSTKSKGGAVSSSAVEQNLSSLDITEDESVDPESDRSHFIAVLVECLAKLDEVPKTISEMRAHLESELMDVIRRASQQYVDCAYQQGEINLSTQEQPLYLLELLELIFEQFRCVVHSHNVIIRNLKRVKSSQLYNYKGLSLYDITEVWSKIQLVIQSMLAEYLMDTSIQKMRTSRSVLNSEVEAPVVTEKFDANQYFNRRRVHQRKGQLFSFSGSNHAINLEKYQKEQRNAAYETGDVADGAGFNSQPLVLVCKPGISNITPIYKTLEGFANEVEMAIGCDHGECNLHKFVTAFVKKDFNTHIQGVMHAAVAEETERFDHLKNLMDIRRIRQLGASRPLLVKTALKSTVKLVECITRLTELMQALPDYSHGFLNLLTELLIKYRDGCKKSYKEVVKNSADPDSMVISANWATDEDISRLLRSLPNWQHLQYGEDSNLAISDDDRKSLNLQESKILTSNLSQQDSTIPSHEILTEPVQLKLIANLHESLEWLSTQLKDWLASMPVEGQPTQGYEHIPEMEPQTHQKIKNLVEEFKELADVCLLLLHLEIRVHCFYYLMPVAKQSNYHCAIDDMDADLNVVKLNKALTEIEDVMKQSLQPRKFRYIFDGLGHLVASLLINSVQYLKRINANGVKKMCRNIFAIRQSLTNVTSSREIDLDLARQYYELLNLPMDQIVNVVLEQGAKFSEIEYIHLLTLLQRSQPNISDDFYNNQVQRLKKIITEKHVYHV